MPKVYSRSCDFCNEPYEGYGKSFCSTECHQDFQRTEGGAGPDDLPEAPDEAVHVNIPEGSEQGTVTVLASTSTRTPEELFEKSGLAERGWEIVPDSGEMRKHDVPMKLTRDGEVYPVVVPCYYVKVKVRKRWEESSLPQPVVLKVTRPDVARSDPTSYSTLHYSDTHLPHHDPRALNILYQILDFVNPQMVVDHGDTLDCESISKYPKDPFERVTLKDEILMGAEHLGTVHALSPDAEHVWIEGNHEDRLRRLIWKMADDRQAGEILQLEPVRDVLRWKSLLGIGELGWEVHHYPEHKLLFDKLILTHGEKVRKDSGASEKAEYMHYGKGGISGHTHRIGEYNKEVYDGQHGWIGLGCMCAIRTDYVSFPNWQVGFGLLTWSADRKRYALERVRIFDGVAYFRGRRFEGDSTLFGDLARAA